MSQSIIEYDKQNRPVIMTLSQAGIRYEYKYDDIGRTVIIESDNQRSNYRTTICQKLIDFEYKDISLFQEGDVYDIKIEYDNLGKEISLKRINKQKNTEYSKSTFRNSKGNPMIWTEEYNGVTSLGFKVDLNKMLNK